MIDNVVENYEQGSWAKLTAQAEPCEDRVAEVQDLERQGQSHEVAE
jgi:hypothetical protein